MGCHQKKEDICKKKDAFQLQVMYIYNNKDAFQLQVMDVCNNNILNAFQFSVLQIEYPLGGSQQKR